MPLQRPAELPTEHEIWGYRDEATGQWVPGIVDELQANWDPHQRGAKGKYRNRKQERVETAVVDTDALSARLTDATEGPQVE